MQQAPTGRNNGSLFFAAGIFIHLNKSECNETAVDFCSNDCGYLCL